MTGTVALDCPFSWWPHAPWARGRPVAGACVGISCPHLWGLLCSPSPREGVQLSREAQVCLQAEGAPGRTWT